MSDEKGSRLRVVNMLLLLGIIKEIFGDFFFVEYLSSFCQSFILTDFVRITRLVVFLIYDKNRDSQLKSDVSVY